MDLEGPRLVTAIAAILAIASTLQSVVNLTDPHVNPTSATLAFLSVIVTFVVLALSVYRLSADNKMLKGIATYQSADM